MGWHGGNSDSVVGLVRLFGQSTSLKAGLNGPLSVESGSRQIYCPDVSSVVIEAI